MSSFLPSRSSNRSFPPAQPSLGKSRKPPKPANSSGDLRRASSLGSWFKQILPSNRPERGGTLRPSKTQVQKDREHTNSDKPQPLPASQDRWTQRVDVIASKRVTDWTLPRNVSVGGSVRKLVEGDQVMDVDRKWNAASGEESGRRGKQDFSRESRPALVGKKENQLNLLDTSASGSHSTSTPDLQSILAKQEARRLRRNLKESGDYLGVQGFNPETGKLDVITPSESGKSSLSQETQQKLLVLKNTLKDARHNYKTTKEKSEQEAKRLLLKTEKQKVRRLEKSKERAQEISQTVTWKRHARQWSSAQEPNLSPIAQSIAETPQASRKYSFDIIRSNSYDGFWTGKQTRVYDGSVAKRNSESSLIDLNYSDKESALNIASERRHKEPTKSPDSAGTVVRTPHRQSYVDFAETGPSAWELFVNGISFDTSEDQEQLQGHKPIDSNAQRSTTAHGAGEVLQAEGQKGSDHEMTQVNAESFLEVGSKKMDDPGGSKLDVGTPASSTQDRTAKGKIPQEHNQKRCGRFTLPPRYWSIHHRIDTMDHGNMRLLRRKLSPNVINKHATRTREAALQIGEHRRKIMPDWGHWKGRSTTRFAQNSKPSSPRMLDRLAEKTLLQQRGGPVLDVESDSNQSNSGGSELNPGLAQHVALSRLMLSLGKHTKCLSLEQGPKQRKQTDVVDSAATNTTCEMIQARGSKQIKTRKEMTKSSSPTVTKYVSTHIITTTGCDRFQPRKGFQANSDQKSNSHQSQLAECQRGRDMYSLPPIAISESSLGSSVTKILQKSSSRVRLAKDDDEIGITSKCNPRQVDWRMDRDMKPFLGIDDAAMSKPNVTMTAGAGVKDVRVADQSSTQGGDVVEDQHESKEGSDNVSISVEKPNEAAAVSREDKDTHADQFIEDELTWLIRAPGRFPHLGVGAHITGVEQRCGVQPLADIPSASMLDTIGQFLGVVWCYMLPLWQVYWERVGPLFDLKSDYWARQDRDEGTVADCLTVVLAIPTSVLFIASYVAALRLGLLCAENLLAWRGVG
ncbi:hypothetical protein E4U41_006297 [Claviceps citrina]|nr:hypothetical protein E4U41_006297 [Claviceps citrina]